MNVMTKLSYQELSLLLFALEGGNGPVATQHPVCEELCPIIESHTLPHAKRLARHLNDHLREGLIDCGVFEAMQAIGTAAAVAPSTEGEFKLRQANRRLSKWSCELHLSEADKQTLRDAISRLPRTAWLTMPRTMWQLRKKLRG
jgi:hypothetical protein